MAGSPAGNPLASRVTSNIACDCADAHTIRVGQLDTMRLAQRHRSLGNALVDGYQLESVEELPGAALGRWAYPTRTSIQVTRLIAFCR